MIHKITRKLLSILSGSVMPSSLLPGSLGTRPSGCFLQGPLLGLGLVLILLFGWSLTNSTTAYLQDAIAPVPQSEMAQDRIYAYRDWQSVGLRVEDGDIITIDADGRWLYTPDEHHGPEGHPRFMAPSFYPLRGPGGALIGRIGERGRPFYIGRSIRMMADDSGLLYMRINDDMLSDNDGVILAKVSLDASSDYAVR